MKKDLVHSLAWGGGIVVLALAASLARNLGYIDQELTTRIVIAATGLMIVAFGNRIPKTFTPNECARKAQRVAGWYSNGSVPSVATCSALVGRSRAILASA